MIGEFRERILARRPLAIRGGGSKDFYGQAAAGEVLDTRGHTGIVAYEPTELVITARAGTPLAEIEAALAAEGQMLAFEPPRFDAARPEPPSPPARPEPPNPPVRPVRPEPPVPSVRPEPVEGRGEGRATATVGGCVAAGLAGPRRAAAGAVRDYVLGLRLMDGEGRELRFGGQVMKNVAGFDVSRLLVGSLGVLGLILEVSLKVLPKPVAEASLRLDLPQGKALEAMNAWAGQPLPISATCWQDDALTVRLSGAAAAVAAARARIGGDEVAGTEAAVFWSGLKEQRLVFFAGDGPLWRLSLPSVAPALDLPGDPLIEWNGSQRWLRGDLDPAQVRELAARAGGHATLFRGGDKSVGVFTPLPTPLLDLHRRLKAALDPHRIFNPGRLYPDL